MTVDTKGALPTQPLLTCATMLDEQSLASVCKGLWNPFQAIVKETAYNDEQFPWISSLS